MKMENCKGITRTGNNCKRKAKEGGYCFQHQQELKFIQEKPDECLICCDALSEDTPLPCGHWIHLNCIIRSGKAECPVCRSPVVLNERDTKSLQEIRIQRREEEIQEEQEEIIRDQLEAQIYQYIEAQLEQLITELPEGEFAHNYLIRIEFD